MSIEAMVWAINAPLGGAAKLVLIGLANHAHADGSHAFPTVDTLAGYAHVDRRTVQRALRSLENEGLIRCDGKGANGQNSYSLHMGRHDAARDIGAAHGGDTSAALGGDTQVLEGATPTPPEPSREPSSVVVERERAFADLGLISEQVDVASNALVLIAGFERGTVQVDEIRIRRAIEQVLPPAETDWDEVGRRVRDGIQAGRIKSQAPSGALGFVLKSLDGVPVIGQPQRPAAAARPLTADEQRRQRNAERRARAAAAMNDQSAGLAAGLMSSTEDRR